MIFLEFLPPSLSCVLSYLLISRVCGHTDDMQACKCCNGTGSREGYRALCTGQACPSIITRTPSRLQECYRSTRYGECSALVYMYIT